jgi:hypothetical protein
MYAPYDIGVWVRPDDIQLFHGVLAKADANDLLARHDCPRASVFHFVQDTARSFSLFRYHLQDGFREVRRDMEICLDLSFNSVQERQDAQLSLNHSISESGN